MEDTRSPTPKPAPPRAMERSSGGNGDFNNTHTAVEVVTSKASSVLQGLRPSLPTVGTRGRDLTSTEPQNLLHEKKAGDDGGKQGDGNREPAVVAPCFSRGPEGGPESTGGRGGGGGEDGGGGGDSGSGSTSDAAADAAVAAAAAEHAAAALAATGPEAVVTSEEPTNQKAKLEHSTGKQAEEHLSFKYTKEELMARHWGMNMVQMKRVKALLTMGVCEEDLEIADRLLKMGRFVVEGRGSMAVVSIAWWIVECLAVGWYTSRSPTTPVFALHATIAECE